MPEGDTLHRTAGVLRRALQGGRVRDARGRPGGPQLERVVGHEVRSVEARGKHLLIAFDHGLTLHTHLGMKGSWHRYRPREPWRGDPRDAVAVIETEDAVAVCFRAPTIELIDSRAVGSWPGLRTLGPDLLAPDPDLGEAVARLTAPWRSEVSVAEAILDQSAVSGIGNVYRSELLHIEKLDPFRPVGTLPPDRLLRLLGQAVRLLRLNVGGGERVTMVAVADGAQPAGPLVGQRRGRRWVYRRAGLPCRRCGTLVRSTLMGTLPRRLYWCPTCQRSDGDA